MRIEYYYGNHKRRLTARRHDGDESLFGPESLLQLADPFVRSMVASPLMAGPLSVEPPSALAGPVSLGPTAILTSEIATDEPSDSELRWVRNRYGFVVTQESPFGKVVLSAPQDAKDPERLAAKVAAEMYKRGNVRAAQPDFIRIFDAGFSGDSISDGQWALNNRGDPGIIGADVAAMAAWTITAGRPDIRVAVLDDGVDTTHPALAGAVVVERDFVNDAATAGPATPADWHGTACAGVIASRDQSVRGLASQASIVACRVGSRGINNWITRDSKVAAAIDWCWDEAAADVLSMSWNNGPPSDHIELAINRARSQGRAAKGSVVVASAGNSGGPVVFPARVDGVLAVGATNEWDQRKTTTSEDGDTSWASNMGPGLGLMAPGVRIKALGLTGPSDHVAGAVSDRFSGTSAAAPFVAAAAAMILSVRDDLSEAQVRNALQCSADSLGPTKWDPAVGSGRLNAFLALRCARKIAK